MGDFPILLILLIVYLIAASSGGKKKKQQKRVPQSAQRSPRTRARAQRNDRGFAAAFEDGEARREQECLTQPIHLHETTQEQMAFAGEGEDPCHAGGRHAQATEEEAFVQEPDTLAQDILRGVVMSQILERPSERRARNRRGYHG